MRDHLAAPDRTDAGWIDTQRQQCLQCGVTIGFSSDRITLRLSFLARGNTLMGEQILVQIGNPARICRCRHGGAIGTDGRCKIGGLHQRQRLTFLHCRAHGHQQLADRA
jgi:hypothetical protein